MVKKIVKNRLRREKMIIKKADEMERFQSEKSSVYAYAFYGLALLAWSLYDFIIKGELGLQFIILVIGIMIFFGSKILYTRRMG